VSGSAALASGGLGKPECGQDARLAGRQARDRVYLLEISYSLEVKHLGDLMSDLLEGKIALFGQRWETFSWASSRQYTS
jgi:hypothetical protein